MGARRSESNADETPREVYSQACFRGGRLFTLGLSCVALGHNKRNTLRKATNIGRCNSPLRKGKYVPSVMPSGSIFHSNCEAVVRSKFALNCKAPRPDCKPQDFPPGPLNPLSAAWKTLFQSVILYVLLPCIYVRKTRSSRHKRIKHKNRKTLK